jgi:hypothetical protein
MGETYNSQWQAYVAKKESTWLTIITQEGEKPIKVNGWANGYNIQTCGSSCVITLYYRPQARAYIGLAITAFTLLLCLGYLGYEWGKHIVDTKRGKVLND